MNERGQRSLILAHGNIPNLKNYRSLSLFQPPQSSIYANTWRRNAKRRKFYHHETSDIKTIEIVSNGSQNQPSNQNNQFLQSKDTSTDFPLPTSTKKKDLNLSYFSQLTQLASKPTISDPNTTIIYEPKSKDGQFDQINEFISTKPSQAPKQTIFENGEISIFLNSLSKPEIAKLLRAKEKMGIENEYLKNSEEKLENLSKIVNNQISNLVSYDLIKIFYDDRPHQCQICGLRLKSTTEKSHHLEFHYEQKEKLQQETRIYSTPRHTRKTHPTTISITKPQPRHAFIGLTEWIYKDSKITSDKSDTSFGKNQLKKMDSISYHKAILDIFNSDISESHVHHKFLTPRSIYFFDQILNCTKIENSHKLQEKELANTKQFPRSKHSELDPMKDNYFGNLSKKTENDLWLWAIYGENGDKNSINKTPDSKDNFILNSVSSLQSDEHQTINVIASGIISVIEISLSSYIISFPILSRQLCQLIRTIDTKKSLLLKYTKLTEQSNLCNTISENICKLTKIFDHFQYKDDSTSLNISHKIILVLTESLKILYYLLSLYKSTSQRLSNISTSKTFTRPLIENCLPMGYESLPHCPVCLEYFEFFWDLEQDDWCYSDIECFECCEIVDHELKNSSLESSEPVISEFNNDDTANSYFNFDYLDKNSDYSNFPAYNKTLKNIPKFKHSFCPTLLSKIHFEHLQASKTSEHFDNHNSITDTDLPRLWNISNDTFWSLYSSDTLLPTNDQLPFQNYSTHSSAESYLNSPCLENSQNIKVQCNLEDYYKSHGTTNQSLPQLGKKDWTENFNQRCLNPHRNSNNRTQNISSAHSDCWIAMKSFFTHSLNDLFSHYSTFETTLLLLIQIMKNLIKVSNNAC